jgi:uncharacterized protein YoxC
VETTLIVAEIIALGALVVLSVFLILVLIRLRTVLTNLERDIRQFSDRAIPVLENLEDITSKFRTVATSIEQEVGSIKQTLGAVRQITENIVSFERRVQERIETPVMEVVSVISAIFTGIRTFIERLRS